MIKSTPISVASNGDNQAIAGVAGKLIRVLSFVLVSSGAVNATFKSKPSSGSQTNLTGAMPLAANTVVPSPPAVWTPGGLQGQFECNPGEDLNLNLSGAVGVYGWLTYQLITV